MITYEEALKIARENKPNVDYCQERQNAYIFSSSEDDEEEGVVSMGGPGSPIVIMKEDGEAINFSYYMLFLIDHGKDDIREFEIK